MTRRLFLGIDVGTSAVRAGLIDDAGTPVADARADLPPPDEAGPAATQDAAIWWTAVERALAELGARAPLQAVSALAVDGTSGTVLLTDDTGTPVAPARLYYDHAAVDAARNLTQRAPSAVSPYSPLARALMIGHSLDPLPDRLRLQHQADWILGHFTGNFGLSDENNALKTGYDPVTRTWPDWITGLELPFSLPVVGIPGTSAVTVAPGVAAQFGLSPGTTVAFGTTDSTAGFLATGAADLGDAVSSLGSTLAVKLLVDRPVFEPETGVYSHRLGDLWLAGGASNTGGRVVDAYFDRATVERLSAQIDPDRPSDLDYYPLRDPGERFPIADPALQPRLTPRPDDDSRFLQGIFEGMARIEATAYRRLETLAGTRVRRVLSVGGAARNPAFSAMRAKALGRPVEMPDTTEAWVGAARLAQQSVA